MIRPFSFSDLDSILQIESQSFPKSPYDWTTFLNLHSLYPETFLVYINTNQSQKREEILGIYHLLSRRTYYFYRRPPPPSKKRHWDGTPPEGDEDSPS